MSCVLRGINRIFLTNKSCFCTSAHSPAYKSAISLQNLYPNSNQNIVTPAKPTTDGKTFTGYIPVEDLTISYSRSSGPGGQNVNMVNTKVDLRFNIEKAAWIPQEIKTKLVEKYKTRINKEGCLVFRSELTRSQQLNLADCLQKVRTAVYSVITSEPVVTQETQEKLRRRHEKAIRERLLVKRHRSQIKADRASPAVNL